MKVSLKAGLPLMAVGTLFAASSCVSSPLERTKEYMMNAGHNQKELNNVLNGIDADNSKSLVILQSRLDSAAYRDLFNTTSAAKDSSKVAEFNKIAAKYRAEFSGSNAQYQRPYEVNADFIKPINSLIKKLTDSNISIKELDEIKSRAFMSRFDTNTVRLSRLQHYTDDWAYKNFFKKAGLFKGDFPQKIKNLSYQLRP